MDTLEGAGAVSGRTRQRNVPAAEASRGLPARPTRSRHKETCMHRMNRRYFCGTSLLALPLMKAFAGGDGGCCSDTPPDPVLDALADDFARTTIDAERGGFGAEHFRRYALQVRLLDAHLEGSGINRRMNRKLNEDDFLSPDPEATVRMARDYWRRRGILFDEAELARLAAVDARSCQKVRGAIRRQGGVRSVHAAVAAAFERAAEECGAPGLRGGLTVQDGFLVLSRSSAKAPGAAAVPVQFDISDFVDPGMLAGKNLDCLCSAVLFEGTILSVLCASVCPPCCIPAVIMLAFVTLMRGLGYCDPDRC